MPSAINLPVPRDQDDELAVPDDDRGEEGGTEPSTVAGESLYPSAIGLSFTLAADNPDLTGLVLDMKALAKMAPFDLIANLERLPEAHRQWITRERARTQGVSGELTDHSEAARLALADCERACERIAAGVATLSTLSVDTWDRTRTGSSKTPADRCPAP